MYIKKKLLNLNKNHLYKAIEDSGMNSRGKPFVVAINSISFFPFENLYLNNLYHIEKHDYLYLINNLNSNFGKLINNL